MAPEMDGLAADKLARFFSNVPGNRRNRTLKGSMSKDRG